MKEFENGNSQEMDMQISLAMDKIIQDTIGHIPISEDSQSEKGKKKKFKVRKSDSGKKTKGKHFSQAAATKENDEVKNDNVPAAVPDTVSNKPVRRIPAMPAMPDQMVQSRDGKKNWSTLRKVMTVLIIIAVLAGVGAYGSFAYYYRDKFIPGTTINGIACHQLTVSETEELIRDKVENYTLNITFREDKNQDISGADIGYAYVPDGSVQRIMQDQNWLGWIFGFVKPRTFEAGEDISFDEEKLQQQLQGLECMQQEAQVAPVDAFVNYQNGQFEIVPEVEGTAINNEIILAAVKQAISESQAQVSAEEAGAYLQPQVRSDSEQLAAEQGELNALVNASVTYQLPGGEEVLDGNTLRSWLQVDEQGHYVKDEEIFRERLTEYVAELAARTDTVGTDRPFTTTSGREITVGGGTYGWKINQSEEIAVLAQNLDNFEQIAREPVYSSTEFSTENNGFGNTYIELNLTDQTLHYYQDGEVVVQSNFVSGRMTKARYTPPGIFTLYYKTKDRILRGTKRADGSYEYESHVNFWMPFNGGIGLHDASWRSSYGGTIYKYKGSHGCINMPYEKAKAVYEIITKEVPIICFYTDGYSFVY